MSNLDETTTSATALDDPTLNALPDDETISVDWDAQERESGGFKPRIMPGSHNFTFHLEDQKDGDVTKNTPEQPFGKQTSKNSPKADFVVTHKADITYVASDQTEKVATIRFIRASSFRSPNMIAKKMNSQLGKLLKALGIHAESMSAIKAGLQEADGRYAPGKITTGLELYCKECKTAVRTNPRKGDTRWPKEKGQWSDYVTCGCGKTSGPGRESVEGYMPPAD